MKKNASKTKTSNPASKRSSKENAAARVVQPKAAAAAASSTEAVEATTTESAESRKAVPREFSKKAIVIEMMRSKYGATLAEIAKATDWQFHSIRGFISGSLTKKMGLKVESAKNEAGERAYRILAK